MTAADATADLTRNLDRSAMSSKEFEKQRDRELKAREKLFTKEVEQTEERLQAEKDALRELKDARDQLAQSVSGNFMSSLFGGTDLAAAFQSGALGSEFGQGLNAYAYAESNKEGGLQSGNMADYVDAYLATLSPERIQELTGRAVSGTLAADTKSAEAFQKALEALTKLGLDGGLFQELATSGDVGAAQYYGSLSSRELNQLERQYDRRNRAAQAVGVSVGAAEYGRDIRQQTKVAEDARDEARQSRQALNRLERRMERIEKLAERNPEETGKATGKAITAAVSAGQRSSK